ncbi:flavodoxin [Floccifex sp.]|uniref:flavodoxin n=1 Tax=Floccifex sp. TaxID=2815810 RepID=UPI003F04EAF0
MTKLVAYYSRADENYFSGKLQTIKVGNTEKVAKMISNLMGADLYKIEQKYPYASDYNTCIVQAKEDKKNNTRPELTNPLNSVEQYDEIYLGYPNYWSTMPMAVYTFLESFDFKDKIIHPFCTHEGSGLSNTENVIKKITHAKVNKGLAIVGSNVDDSLDLIERWINI